MRSARLERAASPPAARPRARRGRRSTRPRRARAATLAGQQHRDRAPARRRGRRGRAGTRAPAAARRARRPGPARAARRRPRRPWPGAAPARPPAARRQRDTSSQATQPRPQTTPKRVSSTSPRVARAPTRAVVPCGGRGLEHERRERRRARPATAGADEQPRAQRRGEGARRRRQAPAPPAAARSAGSQTSSSTASTPSASAIAAYCDRARDGERDRRHRAGVLVAEQLGDARRRRGRLRADAEHEAAADGVRVGRDDAVGRGVAAVGQRRRAAGSPTSSPRPRGWNGSPCLDLRARRRRTRAPRRTRSRRAR